MKALVSLVLGVALVGGVYLATSGGCGARGQVAKDKVIEKIDALLGKLDVQQKKIEIEYDKLKDATRKVREDKTRSIVELESINREKAALEQEQAKIVANLKKLQPMLKAAQESGEFTGGGKTYKLEQLKALADDQIRKNKSIKAELDGRVKTLVAAWTKNVDFLSKQAKSADEQLKRLEDRIEEIKAKKSAVDATRQASLIAGPDKSSSINTKFEEVNADVENLFKEVETAMRIEEAKLDEQIMETSTSTASIEELLKDDTDVSGTLDEIGDILNQTGSGDKE